MASRLSLTVRQLLDLPELQEARVVAGHAGLDRLVRGVNVMEVPDVVAWVRPGDFLMTTGYAVRENPGLLVSLISDLADRGLAALGFKPRRYFTEIPQPLIDEAECKGFPLLELPFHLSFRDVIQPLVRELLSRQEAFLLESDRLHRHLMDLALVGRDLSAVARGLGEVLSNPVLIEGRDAGMRACYPHPQAIAELVDALPVADPEQLPIPAALEETLAVSDTPLQYAWVDVDGRPILQVTAPVIAGGEQFGRITLWEQTSPLTRLSYVALERTITIAAFEIVKQRAVVEVERRYRNVLLDQLLSTGAGAMEAIAQQERLRAWDLGRGPLGVAVIDSTGSGMQLYEKINRQLTHYFRQPRVLVGEKAGKLVVVAAAELLAEPASWLTELCLAFKEQNVRVGIGRAVDDPANLKQSYKQALHALEISKEHAMAQSVVRFDQLGVLRLLHLIHDHDEVAAFLAETVHPLLEYDQTHGTDLLETLRVYCSEQGNARRVAEKMYLHYNTVLYRLKRIEQITGISLTDPDYWLNMQVSLKLLELNRVI